MRVGWALINYGPIFSPVYDSHLRAIAKASRHFEVNQIGRIGGIGATDRMYTHSAECQVVRDMLAIEDMTHIFMTESDMLLPDDTLIDLAEVDKPIVSGLYFLRGGDGQPCLYKKMVSLKEEDYGQSPIRLYPRDRPFKLNGCCGLGCVLIKREVFEKVPYPWFDLNQLRYGSDMFFYGQVRKHDIEIWVNPKVTCGQMEYKVWGLHDYEARLKDDPQWAGGGGIVGFEDIEEYHQGRLGSVKAGQT